MHAFRGLNLEVEPGEIFGFLGPNGAGKTITIRCMLDLIRPNRGTIKVFGIDPQKSPQAVKEKVGYLPGNLRLEGDFTTKKFLKHIRQWRGNNRSWNDLMELAERIDLSMDMQVKNLSQGNKQKVGFLQSFVSEVPLMMLDEPTLGPGPVNETGSAKNHP